MLDEGNVPISCSSSHLVLHSQKLIVTFTNQKTLEGQRFYQSKDFGADHKFVSTVSGLCAEEPRCCSDSLRRTVGSRRFVFPGTAKVLFLPHIMILCAEIASTVTDVSHMLWLSFSPHSRDYRVLSRGPNRHSELFRSANLQRVARNIGVREQIALTVEWLRSFWYARVQCRVCESQCEGERRLRTFHDSRLHRQPAPVRQYPPAVQWHHKLIPCYCTTAVGCRHIHCLFRQQL